MFIRLNFQRNMSSHTPKHTLSLMIPVSIAPTSPKKRKLRGILHIIYNTVSIRFKAQVYSPFFTCKPAAYPLSLQKMYKRYIFKDALSAIRRIIFCVQPSTAKVHHQVGAAPHGSTKFSVISHRTLWYLTFRVQKQRYSHSQRESHFTASTNTICCFESIPQTLIIKPGSFERKLGTFSTVPSIKTFFLIFGGHISFLYEATDTSALDFW